MNTLDKKQIKYESNVWLFVLCEYLYKTNTHAEQGSTMGSAVSHGITAVAVVRYNTDAH